MSIPANFRIKVGADERAGFTVMFEPSGMTYDLGPNEHMYADVPTVYEPDMEIVHWPGGISIFAPGPVVTYDSDGTELHHLH